MKPTDKISAYLTYKEVTHSTQGLHAGIVNEPDVKQLAALRAWGDHIHTPIREYFGVPVLVNSVFRNPAVNKLVGGSSTSQHLKGEAGDIDQGSGIWSEKRQVLVTNRVIFEYIRDNLDFDQLIYEYGDNFNPDWVHVSFTLNGTNKKDIRRKYSGNPRYLPYK